MKSRNPVILRIMHHCQNPLEFNWRNVFIQNVQEQIRKLYVFFIWLLATFWIGNENYFLKQEYLI
jgi:hypothetical protein